MEKVTSFKITTTTREKIQILKRKYHYSTGDLLIMDMLEYFEYYKISPKSAKEPVAIQFQKFGDRFFGAFSNFRKKLEPQVEQLVDVANIYIMEKEKDILGNLENEITLGEGRTPDFFILKEKKQEILRLLEDFDQKKKQKFSDEGAFYELEVKDYNVIMEKLRREITSL